ncbi:MAG: nuclear transport factor 2 family protein [Actinobacteria bacterium]|nr:nuclear transport factor 2 family protein [Actinomycetota bacterium]
MDSGLDARLGRLEDERAILDTLYAYGHSIDYGERNVWLDCFTPSAILRWPHATLTGHDEIGVAFDEHSHAPQAFHKHFLVEPRIRVEGDCATADSYFTRIDDGPSGPFLRSFGRYRDVLVRCADGRWRIQERLAERESLVPEAPVT